MHIPDGYLSPQSYAPLWALAALAWAVASRKLRGALDRRQVPYLAMAAAFSFLVQMFNVPVPGGAAGHAVGAGIIALLLGPSAAVLGVSVVLFIQALVFGDGGLTALGANVINMAVIMPLVAYWTFRALSGGATRGRRLYIAAFLSGYLGLTASALSTGVMLGLQPLIASAPDGTPLYAPYPLAIAVPAMALSHLLFFAVLEGVLTASVLGYFIKHEPGLVHAITKYKLIEKPHVPQD